MGKKKTKRISFRNARKHLQKITENVIPKVLLSEPTEIEDAAIITKVWKKMELFEKKEADEAEAAKKVAYDKMEHAKIIAERVKHEKKFFQHKTYELEKQIEVAKKLEIW